MGMEGQGPVAAAHGRSLSRDYRVCAGPRGADHRDVLAGVSVCMHVCVWALDSDHRVCACLAEKIAGTAMLKKTTTGGDARLRSTKREREQKQAVTGMLNGRVE